MLVRGLLGAVSASKDGRIVFLGSEAHRKYSAEDMTFSSLENVNKERSYLQRYGTHPPYPPPRCCILFMSGGRSGETCGGIAGTRTRC